MMQCADFSEFQEVLKTMRRADDLIVNTLNAIIPTDSFTVERQKACHDLYKQLNDGHAKRESTIKECINVTADQIKNLKDQRETNSNNPDFKKTLRHEQTKLRMLQVELSVEELVQERSNKVFHERCRRYYKP